jgi:predicted nucleotidyltransferase
VKIFWLNKGLLDKALEEIVQRMGRDVESIRKIILFGSQAEHRATPFSDVDILIILNKTDKPFLDRSAPFRDYFLELGLDTDIFVYTEEEFKKSSFLKVIKEGRYKVLFERDAGQ